MNFEDPQVWNAKTDIEKGKQLTIGLIFNVPLRLAKQLWKKSYGFDFVSFTPGNGITSDGKNCLKNCLKAEYSNFAKKCKKKGGFFKCCMSG